MQVETEDTFALELSLEPRAGSFFKVNLAPSTTLQLQHASATATCMISLHTRFHFTTARFHFNYTSLTTTHN